MDQKKVDAAYTNKPQGGWSAPAWPYDPADDLKEIQSGKFTGLFRLIEHFGHPDAIPVESGSGPLMACIASSCFGEAKRLLDLGANPDRNPKANQDCTYVGAILRFLDPGVGSEMLSSFLKAGASPDLAIDSSGDTPLVYCAKNALPGPAAILAQWRANPFAKGSDGLDAMDWALRLPGYQKSLLLFAMFPPPLDLDAAPEAFFEKLEASMAPENCQWLLKAWTQAEA